MHLEKSIGNILMMYNQLQLNAAAISSSGGKWVKVFRFLDYVVHWTQKIRQRSARRLSHGYTGTAINDYRVYDSTVFAAIMNVAK